ncbi:MAG: type II toxin-antitoxin system VapC family toxin [Verrucomicrobiia bacterium]
MIYFDATYLVRLYLTEPGSEEVRALCATHQLCSASHAQAEVPAAIHRAFREGRLSPEVFAAALGQFAMDQASDGIRWLPLSHALLGGMVSRFSKMPRTTFLRAADALHLACAAEHGFTEVYSNDRHFLAAAPLFGLKGHNILGNHEG